MNRFLFLIDVVGTCNLRCPSCPQGNSREIEIPGGRLTPEFLDEILKKALGECEVESVSFYNWTEPLIHPQLPELIRVVHSHSLPCGLSSNLNYLGDIDAVMRERPSAFTVSLSGFTQAVYSRTHRKGNIELVKENMARLSELVKREGMSGYFGVSYHLYRHNQHEVELMKEYAEELGFIFAPIWAHMWPLEKGLSCLGEDCGVELTESDYELIDLLGVSPQEATDIAKTHRRYKDKDCGLLTSQIVINHIGDVQLCCAVYDPSKYSVGNYLSTPIDEIQRRRFAHSICSKCMKHGFHVLCSEQEHLSELDETARRNLGRRSVAKWKSSADLILKEVNARKW